MKQLYTFAFALLFPSQWSAIDHAYHEHQPDEVCDVCINSQPLDHAVITSVSFIPNKNKSVKLDGLCVETGSGISVRFYSARAPPTFI